jgi:group I intron endonuclease
MQVYLITNKVNGKQYIGQTVRPLHLRWNSHTYAAREGAKFALPLAILKYGASFFTMESLHVCESQEEMDFVECFYIALLDTMAPNGYNLTPGGEHPVLTDESKKKMSLAKQGRCVNPETCFQPGQHASPETEIKRGQHLSSSTEFEKGLIPWNKGKPLPYKVWNKGVKGVSGETRAKMSSARLGKPRPPGTWMLPHVWEHGTSYGYQKMKCRCELCRKYRHDLHLRTGN